MITYYVGYIIGLVGTMLVILGKLEGEKYEKYEMTTQVKFIFATGIGIIWIPFWIMVIMAEIYTLSKGIGKRIQQ